MVEYLIQAFILQNMNIMDEAVRRLTTNGIAQKEIAEKL